jgi:hypothetical protein
MFFWQSGAIWAPQNVLKKVLKGLQVEGNYGLMSKHKTRPLTKSFSSFLKKNGQKTNKHVLCSLWPLWAHLGTQKDTQRATSGMFGPMSELKNKPLNKLLGPFF